MKRLDVLPEDTSATCATLWLERLDHTGVRAVGSLRVGTRAEWCAVLQERSGVVPVYQGLFVFFIGVQDVGVGCQDAPETSCCGEQVLRPSVVGAPAEEACSSWAEARAGQVPVVCSASVILVGSGDEFEDGVDRCSCGRGGVLGGSASARNPRRALALLKTDDQL